MYVKLCLLYRRYIYMIWVLKYVCFVMKNDFKKRKKNYLFKVFIWKSFCCKYKVYWIDIIIDNNKDIIDNI